MGEMVYICASKKAGRNCFKSLHFFVKYFFVSFRISMVVGTGAEENEMQNEVPEVLVMHPPITFKILKTPRDLRLGVSCFS